MKHRKLQIGPKGGTQPDINVTPLVDVVLVLLIIFMVVTPLVEREMIVKTPPIEKNEPPQPPDPNDTQVMLNIKADGKVTLNDEEVPEKELVARLQRVLAAKKDKIVFFAADDAAGYEVAVNVLDDARAAGAKTIGMLTESLESLNAPAPGAPGAAPGAPTPPGAPAPAPTGTP